MTFFEPFDLGEILIERLAGDPTIFIILGVLVIFILAARFRMPISISLISATFFVVIMWGQGNTTAADLTGASLPLMLVVGIASVLALVIIIRRSLMRN